MRSNTSGRYTMRGAKVYVVNGKTTGGFDGINPDDGGTPVTPGE